MSETYLLNKNIITALSLKRSPTRLAMVPDAAIRELTRPREVVRSS